MAYSPIHDRARSMSIYKPSPTCFEPPSPSPLGSPSSRATSRAMPNESMFLSPLDDLMHSPLSSELENDPESRKWCDLMFNNLQPPGNFMCGELYPTPASELDQWVRSTTAQHSSASASRCDTNACVPASQRMEQPTKMTSRKKEKTGKGKPPRKQPAAPEASPSNVASAALQLNSKHDGTVKFGLFLDATKVPLMTSLVTENENTTAFKPSGNAAARRQGRASGGGAAKKRPRPSPAVTTALALPASRGLKKGAPVHSRSIIRDTMELDRKCAAIFRDSETLDRPNNMDGYLDSDDTCVHASYMSSQPIQFNRQPTSALRDPTPVGLPTCNVPPPFRSGGRLQSSSDPGRPVFPHVVSSRRGRRR